MIPATIKDALSALLFLTGFCFTVPMVPWLLWQHSAQTEASMLLLLISLPVYVWLAAYAYLRTYNASEAVAVWLKAKLLAHHRQTAVSAGAIQTTL